MIKKNINSFKIFLLLFFLVFIFPSRFGVFAFTFVAWGDTKSSTSTLQSLSNQVKALNPVLTIYGGDLESAGFTSAGITTWTNALNGGSNNGMFNKTFPVRGNHDSLNSTSWQSYFNLSSNVQAIGGRNYLSLNDDLNYSFDYGNARFIGLDATGSVTQISAAESAWLDQRLTDAENNHPELQHAFIYWHGPIYSVANHCCPAPPADLIQVINRHPILSATFHGHEHVLTYNHLNSAKVPGLTRDLEQFISGDAGAGPTTPTAGKADYWLDVGTNGGFMLVDVSGGTFTVNMYKGGTTVSQWSRTFSKGAVTPPQITATRTPTPILSPTQGGPTATRTRTPTQRFLSATPTVVSPTPGQVCTYFKN